MPHWIFFLKKSKHHRTSLLRKLLLPNNRKGTFWEPMIPQCSWIHVTTTLRLKFNGHGLHGHIKNEHMKLISTQNSAWVMSMFPNTKKAIFCKTCGRYSNQTYPKYCLVPTSHGLCPFTLIAKGHAACFCSVRKLNFFSCTVLYFWNGFLLESEEKLLGCRWSRPNQNV